MRRRQDIEPIDVALGELSGEHAAEAARRMRDDDRFRHEVERLAPVVGRLERLPRDVWTPEEPPPLEVGVRPSARHRFAWGRALVLRPGLALACAAVLLTAGIAGGVLLATSGGGEESGQTVAVPLLPVPADVPGGAARGAEVGRAELRAGETVRLSVGGAVPDRGDAYHELWLLPRAGDPVPVGRFRVDAEGRAVVTFKLPADPGRFAYLDVSTEPDDGDPAHSGKSILRAPV